MDPCILVSLEDVQGVLKMPLTASLGGYETPGGRSVRAIWSRGAGLLWIIWKMILGLGLWSVLSFNVAEEMDGAGRRHEDSVPLRS